MAHTGEIIIGAAVGATWGTAVTVNVANNGILILDDPSVVEQPDMIVDESMGFSWKQVMIRGQRAVEATFSGYLRHTGALHKLLAWLIGTDTPAASGSAFNHVMDLADRPMLFGTLAMADGVSIYEIPSWKPNRLELMMENGLWKFSCRGIGNRVLVTGMSGIVNSSLSSVTPRTKVDIGVFGSTSFRINAQSAGAVSAASITAIKNMKFIFERKHEGIIEAQGLTYGTNEFTVSQPIDDGFADVRLEIELREYTATTAYTDFLAGTLQKSQVTIDGGIAAGADAFQIKLEMPALHYMEAKTPLSSGRKLIPQNLAFECLSPLTNPTGMTFGKPFRLTVKDAVSGAYTA